MLIKMINIYNKNHLGFAVVLFILGNFQLYSFHYIDVRFKEKDTIQSITNLISTKPIFEFKKNESTFYADIPYDEFELTTLDFFKPNQNKPSGLLFIIHGGGFINGDKSKYYSNDYSTNLINELLARNIAVANINYRFITPNNTEGIMKPLMDSKRALQFIRHHAKTLNIDKNNIVLYGSSAGAGTSLWLALSDDMADTINNDEVLRESTRVKGAVCTSTQSNYDLLNWHQNVFADFQNQGFDFNSIKKILSESKVKQYFGVQNIAQINDESIKHYRNKVNMLLLMSNDDPELYVVNKGIPNTIPTNSSELYHHPLHAKALMDWGDRASMKGKYLIPELNIDTRNGESIRDFIIRKLSE
jgi:hypothetical protein